MENNKLLNCIKGINEDSDNVAMTAAVIQVVREYFNDVQIGRKVYNTQDDRDARILLDKYGAPYLYLFAKDSNNGYVIAGDDVRAENVQSITTFNFPTTIKTYFPKIEERLYALREHGQSLKFIQDLYYDIDVTKFFFEENKYQLRKYIVAKGDRLEGDETYYFKTKEEATEYAKKEIIRNIERLENYILNVSSPIDETSALFELTNRKAHSKMALEITKIVF